MSAATRREFLETAAALVGATLMAAESEAAPARLERPSVWLAWLSELGRLTPWQQP